jgi:hypothetical protein
MWTQVLVVMCMSLHQPIQHLYNRQNMRSKTVLDQCQFNWDCDMPQICCKGLFKRYCCDNGGNTRKLPQAVWPNITWPNVPELPNLPTPFPEPVPIPIPIPID